MPPIRKPDTLYTISAKKMNRMLNEAAFRIQNSTHKPYAADHGRITTMLREYLPTEIIDDLYSIRGNSELSRKLAVKGIRIELSFYLHPYTSRIASRYFLKATDAFWKRQMVQMQKLVAIQLPLCSYSDELLTAIVTNCPKIEEITTYKPMFLPITSELAVTWRGVHQLAKLSNLRILNLPNCMCMKCNCKCYKNSKRHEKLVVLDLLRRTQMEYISNYDLTCLMGEYYRKLYMHRLRIRKVDMFLPSAEVIEVLEKMCPELVQVSLTLSSERSAVDSKRLIPRLAESTIRLSSLQLINMIDFSHHWQAFFMAKGEYLRSLSIYTSQTFYWDWNRFSQYVLMVAKLCPLMESLNFEGVFPGDTESSPLVYDTFQKYFQRLKHLGMHGNCWGYNILHLLLDNARKMESLLIDHYQWTFTSTVVFPIGDILDNIFSKNPMLNLKEASFGEKAQVSPSNLDYLVRCCPELKKLKVHDPSLKEKIEELKSHVRAKNLELDISTE